MVRYDKDGYMVLLMPWYERDSLKEHVSLTIFYDFETVFRLIDSGYRLTEEHAIKALDDYLFAREVLDGLEVAR